LFVSDKFPQVAGTGRSDGKTEAKRASTRPLSCKSASAEGQNGNTDLMPAAYRGTSQLPFCRSYCDRIVPDDQPPVMPAGARRLLVGLLGQALQDAQGPAATHRAEARQWLRSDDCAAVCAALDLAHGRLVDWLDRLPDPDAPPVPPTAA